MRKILLMLILEINLWLAGACASWALDNLLFQHVPPAPGAGGNYREELPVEIPAAGIKRARLLMASSGGYAAAEMARTGEVFQGRLRFQDLAVLKYQFQLETTDGKFHETGYYTIRQPSGRELEDQISRLGREAEILKARIRQRESALYALKNADPAEFAKNRSVELARVLLMQSRKQRYVETLLGTLGAEAQGLEEELKGITAPDEVREGRRILEEVRRMEGFK